MGRTIWIPRADHPDMQPLFWALPDAGARDRIAAISSTSAAEKSKRHRDEALAPSAHDAQPQLENTSEAPDRVFALDFGRGVPRGIGKLAERPTGNYWSGCPSPNLRGGIASVFAGGVRPARRGNV